MEPKRPRHIAGGPILLAIVMLLALAPAPAGAITLQRTWRANFSSSAYGSVTMKAYTNGIGTISYGLKAWRANVRVNVYIRKGTCSKPGTTVARPASVITSATGTVFRTDTIYEGQMAAIWSAARGTSFNIMVASGTTARCAAFTFNKATRVVITTLSIDLPVVRGPSGYPYCNVAMYQSTTAQPREPGITFIYAHARRGMFLPLLTKYKASGAAGLLGRVVKVYTSDNVKNYYVIDKVRKTSTATTMNGVYDLSRERLWLQTSTGPNFSYPKLIVEAHRYKSVKTTYAAAHPTPHIVHCS